MNETNKFLTIGLLSLATALALVAILFFTPSTNCYVIVDDLTQPLHPEDQGCKMITVEQFKEQTERF